ncbi:hypothetical protein M9H77_04339 [Catharanthus roseus]|uniref:Uncharacterized protein n=1 Tax=Catharanthus roseus TaxID=4058 RepID=A0ACC0CEA9_CATRO|nr:hypothetical protein M9H77_04339 [Catharanthus roseus]
MDTTHPVIVVLFWDSEHARDAYGTYFTGAIGGEFKVVKSKSNHRQRNVIITVTLTIVHGSSKQASKYEFKAFSKLISHLVANDSEILVSNVIQEMQVLLLTGYTYKRAWCS